MLTESYIFCSFHHTVPIHGKSYPAFEALVNITMKSLNTWLEKEKSRCTFSEVVLEPAGKMTQMAHTPSTCGLPPDGLNTPVVCIIQDVQKNEHIQGHNDQLAVN